MRRNGKWAAKQKGERKTSKRMIIGVDMVAAESQL